MSTPAAAASARESAAPDSVGMAADLAAKIDYGRRAGLLPGLHSVVVARHGKLVAEQYFRGVDDAWGRPLGDVAHGPDTLHDLRSVSKSIVSLLYGIALERGKVPPPSAPLLAQFPQYADLAADPKRAALTIDHAMTMSLGMEWNEQLPYTDEKNSEIQMELAKDRLRYVLDRPIVSEPGKRWVYSGGTSALIGALIAQGTGQKLDAFAKQALFDPLGIERFEWAAGSDAVLSAASGLRLTARDLARMGQLVLDKGMFDGKRIVPADWIASSTAPLIPTGDGLQYGRQWFIGELPVPALNMQAPRWIAGFGNGGQRLYVAPDLGIVAAMYFGNYNQFLSWAYPGRIWLEIVLASVTKA